MDELSGQTESNKSNRYKESFYHSLAKIAKAAPFAFIAIPLLAACGGTPDTANSPHLEKAPLTTQSPDFSSDGNLVSYTNIETAPTRVFETVTAMQSNNELSPKEGPHFSKDEKLKAEQNIFSLSFTDPKTHEPTRITAFMANLGPDYSDYFIIAFTDHGALKYSWKDLELHLLKVGLSQKTEPVKFAGYFRDDEKDSNLALIKLTPQTQALFGNLKGYKFKTKSLNPRLPITHLGIPEPAVLQVPGTTNFDVRLVGNTEADPRLQLQEDGKIILKEQDQVPGSSGGLMGSDQDGDGEKETAGIIVAAPKDRSKREVKFYEVDEAWAQKGVTQAKYNLFEPSEN